MLSMRSINQIYPRYSDLLKIISQYSFYGYSNLNKRTTMLKPISIKKLAINI